MTTRRPPCSCATSSCSSRPAPRRSHYTGSYSYLSCSGCKSFSSLERISRLLARVQIHASQGSPRRPLTTCPTCLAFVRPRIRFVRSSVRLVQFAIFASLYRCRFRQRIIISQRAFFVGRGPATAEAEEGDVEVIITHPVETQRGEGRPQQRQRDQRRGRRPSTPLAQDGSPAKSQQEATLSCLPAQIKRQRRAFRRRSWQERAVEAQEQSFAAPVHAQPRAPSTSFTLSTRRVW